MGLVDQYYFVLFQILLPWAHSSCYTKHFCELRIWQKYTVCSRILVQQQLFLQKTKYTIIVHFRNLSQIWLIKTIYRDFSPLGLRDCGQYWDFGPFGFQSIGASFYWDFVLLGLRSIGTSFHWDFSPLYGALLKEPWAHWYFGLFGLHQIRKTY